MGFFGFKHNRGGFFLCRFCYPFSFSLFFFEHFFEGEVGTDTESPYLSLVGLAFFVFLYLFCLSELIQRASCCRFFDFHIPGLACMAVLIGVWRDHVRISRSSTNVLPTMRESNTAPHSHE